MFRTSLIIFNFLLPLFVCAQKPTVISLDTVTIKNYVHTYTGFTSDQKRSFHHQLQEAPLAWLQGNGDMCRYVFLHLTEFEEHSMLGNQGTLTPMDANLRDDVAAFITTSRLGQMPLKEYIFRDEVDGLIILHHGNIVFEEYPRMHQDDFHIWFSVSKVVVSTAIGILEDRGRINVHLPIEFYFEELKGSGWEGVPVVDILSMSSGIACTEVYILPEAECYFTTREMYGWPDTERALPDPIGALSRLSSHGPSGQIFEYTSVNTMLLTLLIEKLTGETYKDFIEREIWSKMGTESVGFLLSGAYGRDGSWLGMNSTLRDLARFGLLFTPTGRAIDQPVVSDAFLAKIQSTLNESLRTKSWFSEELKYNGYQWDEIYDDGDFYKHGHCAQGLYISPSKDLVIAFFGTKSEDFVENQLPFIARQLATSGLFAN